MAKKAAANKKEVRKWLVTIRQKPPDGGKPIEVTLEIAADSVLIDQRGALVFYSGKSWGDPTGVIATFQAGSWLRAMRPDRVAGAVPPIPEEPDPFGSEPHL